LEVTLKYIAESICGTVEGDDQVLIKGINSLVLAEKGEISFFSDPRLKDQVRITKASAIIVKEVISLYQGPQLIVADPSLAYAKVATIFAPPIPRFPGISEKSIIGEGARIGKGVSIYPFVYVGRESTIGNEVTLFPGVYIGERVTVGNESVIYPNVTVMSDCVIGKKVIIHAGTVIGSDGFGFAPQSDDNYKKIPQLGNVIMEDNIEIGANVVIDRATMGSTIIRKGVKLDNLIQIGHNVEIGENTVMAGQSGIAGSTKVGQNCMFGGQVGITGHVKIAKGTKAAAQSGINSHILKENTTVYGTPAFEYRKAQLSHIIFRRLPELKEKIEKMGKEINDIKNR